MRLNNQLLNLWVRNLEVVVTVILLLNFLGVVAPSPIPKLMKALSYGIIFILVILHWKRLSWFATRDIPLLLLVGTALASVFWSADLGSTLSSGRGLLRIVLFGAYFSTRYSLKEQMKILTWVFGIGAILSLVAGLAVPGYSIQKGIFPYKNYMGYSMVIGAITFLLAALKERKPNWLAWGGFCLTVFLTVQANSAGSLVCLLVLLSLMPLYQLIKLQYRPKVIIFCLVCILAGNAAIIILGNLETILVDILGKNIEFNGRTPIWTLVIEKVLEQRLWLGYGLDAFWKSDAGSYVINNTWAGRESLLNQSFNFHSGHIPVFANLGFLGLSLSAISLGTVFIRVVILLLSTKKIEFFWCLQFLIFIFIGGFADDIVSILNASSSYCAIYVTICLSTAVEWRRIGVSQKRYVRTNPSKLARSNCSQSKLL